MEARKNFNTPKAPRMSQAFPQAVITEKFIFLSGTPGLDLHSGQVVSDSFEDQTRQCFHNIKRFLEEAGSSNPPARSTPQVMPFPAGILISVECIALC
ncbi:MAG TPA: RidA family protein [Puia sp.]|jgi:2-iminobutanoate/2-iminopropanoate deaminase|nr:RidA family protein [Puia sp.]